MLAIIAIDVTARSKVSRNDQHTCDLLVASNAQVRLVPMGRVDRPTESSGPGNGRGLIPVNSHSGKIDLQHGLVVSCTTLLVPYCLPHQRLRLLVHGKIVSDSVPTRMIYRASAIHSSCFGQLDFHSTETVAMTSPKNLPCFCRYRHCG